MKNTLRFMTILLFALAMASCTKDSNDGGGNGGNNGVENNGGNNGQNSGENGGGNGGGNGTYNGHEYVDLGLPSGTLWATCNVGANTLEEYGDYFAWGETTIKTGSYDWSTYKYCKGSYNTLTKYCDKSYYGYNGFTDHLAVLLPEDDAVTVNWGDGWSSPSREQWVELYNNTTRIWTFKPSGVEGEIFIASNGNSLFLPAAGAYWSSSLYVGGDCSMAFCLHFNSENCLVYIMRRDFGCSVRPVHSPAKY